MKRRSKKRRTAAQKRATAKMIAARKGALRGKRRRNPFGTKALHRAAAKRPAKRKARRSKARSAAPKKAKFHRTIYGNDPPESKPKRKKARKARAAAKEHTVATPRRRKRRTKTVTARSARGKKRVRVRVSTKARKRGGSNFVVRVVGATEKRRHHRRSRRASNPIVHRRHRRGHRRSNPISGGSEFLSGFLGLATGGLLAMVATRFLATHAVTATASKDANGKTIYNDAPAAGQLYNGEAPMVPFWSNWKVALAGVAAIVLPFGVASKVRSSKAKSFFQLAGFGAMAIVGSKCAADAAAKYLGTNPYAQRLLAPELMAQRDLLLTGASTQQSAVAMNAPTGVLGLPLGSEHTGVGADMLVIPGWDGTAPTGPQNSDGLAPPAPAITPGYMVHPPGWTPPVMTPSPAPTPDAPPAPAPVAAPIVPTDMPPVVTAPVPPPPIAAPVVPPPAPQACPPCPPCPTPAPAPMQTMPAQVAAASAPVMAATSSVQQNPQRAAPTPCRGSCGGKRNCGGCGSSNAETGMGKSNGVNRRFDWLRDGAGEDSRSNS